MRLVHTVATCTIALCLGCGERVPARRSASGQDDHKQQETVMPLADWPRAIGSITPAATEQGHAAVDIVGLENLICVSERIYSGGQPQGEQAFQSLARLGVKTVVSVDGARPDVDAAHRNGLRYVHVPIGY